jgi:predicted DNA-binding transcriptional regulator AlpA
VDMNSNDWVKVPLIAEDLGVSVKTIYNWINVGKLFMPRPGYVSQVEAYEVWLQQRSLRRFQSFFQSSRLVRDGNGRFQSGKDD